MGCPKGKKWNSKKNKCTLKRKRSSSEKKSLTAKVIYFIGIGIVAVTHILIILFGLPQEQLLTHSIINLVAVILIGLGYTMDK